ncbi:di-heme-cytochrome C peroxidase [Azospirillum sp. TSO35-2]|uniref:di-heme-cytochrome C peroxidase n=1 Tax=Azospirillum sp. TSO35-2 TaxID=716796 RepID=UPI000D657668|nr:di-heme-cytochrome C peroxidase [Azospirillum sp. TSO35-2]
MKLSVYATLGAAALLLSACAEPPQPPRPVPVKPPVEINGLWYLDQGWSDDARQWYYNTTQGSQIMRYDWFMALEDPQTGQPFVKSIPRYGYAAGTASGWNPNLLPVGFVKDTDPDKTEWFGMTCAACHTGDVTVNGKTMRIDGAVTTGDLYGFISGLSAAVHATVTSDAAFQPFATRVLGATATDQQKLALYNGLKAFDQSFATFVKDSTPDTPWGSMRTDAFGMIFNRVSVIDLNIPKNNRPPNAPVSYPYLWDAPHQPKVQWNGLLPNTTAFDALGRNAGEVLGVFGKVTLKPPADAAHYYYASTVRGTNLVDMENQLRKLRSPVWPDSLAGSVDIVKAAAGETLYKDNCESCHAILPRGETYSTAPIKMVSLFDWAQPDNAAAVLAAFNTICTKGVDAAVADKSISINYGADPKMAVDALCRTVDTGAIANVAMPPQLLGGTPLKNPDLAANLLSNAVIGAVFGDLVREPKLLMALLKGDDAPAPWLTASAPAGWAPESQTKGGTLDTTPLVKPGVKGTADHQKVIAALTGRGQVKPTVGAVPAGNRTVSALAKAQPTVSSKTTATKTATSADEALAAKIKELMAYKARPLDGVWATAPYMHNGSVPNLYEMLLPASQRSAAFRMGSTAIDPVKVGVDSASPAATFVYDTSKPGNRNTGHEFGAGLTDAQRWQLLEYLKTL